VDNVGDNMRWVGGYFRPLCPAEEFGLYPANEEVLRGFPEASNINSTAVTLAEVWRVNCWN